MSPFEDNYKLLLGVSVAVNRGFVLALLYSMDGRQVVLMQRTRPSWQAGRVNALGGGILVGETPASAARREVREECGVDVEEWTEVLVWDDAEYRMHVMRARSDRAGDARTMEDQQVFLANADALPANVIDNLRWLVPLALDRDVALPIKVWSAAAEGSGLTDRDRPAERA